MYGEAACVSSMCGRELSHEITTCHWQLAKAQLSNRVIPRWPKDDDSEGGFILRRIYNRRDNEREVLSFFFFYYALLRRHRASNERTNASEPWRESILSRVRDASGFFVRRPTDGHRPEDCTAEAHSARLVGIEEISIENFRSRWLHRRGWLSFHNQGQTLESFII